jgi:hypothetical protein
MGWFNEEKPNVVDPANADPDKKPADDPNKPAEKTPAELIAEALKPMADNFNAINTRLQMIEENSKPKPKPVDPPAVASVYEDEDAAFNQRLTPVVLRQLELEARMIKDDIRREYEKDGFGDMWDQYASEIDNVLSGSPLVAADGKPLRGDPGYIRNVVDMVLGRAARTKGLKFNGKEKTFFLESAGGSTEGAGSPTNDGLTDKQRRVFARMGINPADGKKTIEKLQFIN